MATEIEIKSMGNGKIGQEKEKDEISQIKNMASQIISMCDGLMQREDEEDKETPIEPSEEEDGLGNDKIGQAFRRIKARQNQ